MARNKFENSDLNQCNSNLVLDIKCRRHFYVNISQYFGMS